MMCALVENVKSVYSGQFKTSYNDCYLTYGLFGARRCIRPLVSAEQQQEGDSVRTDSVKA